MFARASLLDCVHVKNWKRTALEEQDAVMTIDLYGRRHPRETVDRIIIDTVFMLVYIIF